MKKFTLAMVLMLTICSVMFVFTGCKKKSSNDTMRISEVTHSVFYAPMYVAINNGYFAEENITIELTNAGGSDAVMTALTSKSADVGLLGPEAVVYVRNNGMKNAPTIFAQLTNCDGSFLVGRTDEGASFDWANLKGKRIIGGRRAGMPAMTLKYILEKHGLKPGDELGENVDTVIDLSIAFNLTSSSFVSGIGDYCTMFEPVASQCEQDKTGYIVSSLGSEVKDIPYTVFTATDNFLKNNPKKLEAFVRAIKKGYDYLLTATDKQIVESLKPSFTTTDDALLISSVRNYISIGAYASSPVLSEKAWNNMLDIIDNAGELTNRIAHKDAVNTEISLSIL